MALLRGFDELTKDRQRVHGPVQCGYSTFEASGHRYLQLDTYGSPDRDIPGKTSQSLQLDAAAARRLIEIFQRAFPELQREAGSQQP